MSAVSGYMGGESRQPTYEQVCTGRTGHVEVVQLTFDPQVIGFSQILEIFFATHDPTTLNRQGNDSGPQYRSVIFFHSAEQESIARQFIQNLDSTGTFSAAVVTAVEPASEFWPAEDYHQQYFENHPLQPYCVWVITPKVAKFREKFSDRLKPGAGV